MLLILSGMTPQTSCCTYRIFNSFFNIQKLCDPEQCEIWTGLKLWDIWTNDDSRLLFFVPVKKWWILFLLQVITVKFELVGKLILKIPIDIFLYILFKLLKKLISFIKAKILVAVFWWMPLEEEVTSHPTVFANGGKLQQQWVKCPS